MTSFHHRLGSPSLCRNEAVHRIADGRYTFDGTEHQLPLTEPAAHNAIHGLTRWAHWQLVHGNGVSLAHRAATGRHGPGHGLHRLGPRRRRVRTAQRPTA